MNRPHDQTHNSNSFNEIERSYRNSDVAVLEYSPKHVKELDFEKCEKLDNPEPSKSKSNSFEKLDNPTDPSKSKSKSSSFEPEPETDQLESLDVSVIDEHNDEDRMLELNHRSLRLLQAQIIEHIELIGQSALLYTLEEETKNTFNRALNECFSTNHDLTAELYKLKERHDQMLMDELAEASDTDSVDE